MANVTLSGYPEVFSARVFQKSNADPGTIVVRTEITDDVIVGTATLQCFATGFAGIWSGLTLKRKPRVFRGYMLLAFQDSRSVWKDMTFTKDYNVRNWLGEIDAATEITVEDLWEKIALDSGLTISIESTPNYKPSMLWTGKTYVEGINMLLEATGSRLLYDPVGGTYRVQEAGSGTALTLTSRLYRPVPSLQTKDVHVDSAPVLYEGYFDADAVVENADGDITSLPTEFDPIELFTGVNAVAAIQDRSRYQQSALRLWRLTGTTHPAALTPDDVELFDHRATAIANGTNPLCVSSHAWVQGIVKMPGFQFVAQDSRYDSVSMTRLSGTDIFHSEAPILAVDGAGVIRTTIKVVTSYYVLSGFGRERNRVTKNANATGTDVYVKVPWITPVDSEIPDASAAVATWNTLQDTVADQVKLLYDEPPQTVSIAGAITPGDNGDVGGALYEFVSGRRGKVTTALAIGFVPSNWRMLR